VTVRAPSQRLSVGRCWRLAALEDDARELAVLLCLLEAIEAREQLRHEADLRPLLRNLQGAKVIAEPSRRFAAKGCAVEQVTQSRRHKEREYVGAYVDAREREKLYELAQREDRSVSSVVRRALQAELERSRARA
jgi:tRNA isopentenyl-2-thiomethyl-A-37 hydroxylase MiaE